MNNVQEKLAAIRGLSEITSGKDIRQVDQGGYLEIDSETFKVDVIYKYLDVKWSNFKKRKKNYWVTELQLLNLLTGEKSFLEWEVDDELEVSLTLDQVQLRNIKYNGSVITRHALEEIADEEHGTITLDGTKYHYSEDDTWAALFYRQGDDDPLEVRMYEFSSDNGTGLTIELWEDEDNKPEREAFTSKELNPKKITVLQTKGNELEKGVSA